MNYSDLREGIYSFTGEFDTSLYQYSHDKFVQQSSFKDGCGWLISIPNWKVHREPYKVEGTLKITWFIEKQEVSTRESMSVEEFNMLFTNLQRIKQREEL